LSATAEEWRRWMVERGHPAYRARQVLDWVIRRRAGSFEPMSDLPRALRQELDAEWTVFGTRVVYHDVAPDGTDKLVVQCRDGRRIECVLMAEGPRRTVCISTQVGCGMGCVFCASGLNGVARNLTAGEILEQLVRLRNLLPPGDRLTHIVVMGMGEPLANLDNLLDALAKAGAKEGLGIGARHITISTVGLPARMRRLADLGKQYHLAVSLHAPNDELRNRIVPTNEKTGLAAILEAADYFYRTTKRQVTYEYVLLRDLNDRPEHAAQLARLLRGRQAHVNLIPFNDVAGLPYRRLTQQALDDFLATLRGAGISVKARKRKGADIDAACGQLRRSALAAEPAPAAGV
jgi:23S rRNA (adenine2503-C2)-methyltransferase